MMNRSDSITPHNVHVFHMSELWMLHSQYDKARRKMYRLENEETYYMVRKHEICIIAKIKHM